MLMNQCLVVWVRLAIDVGTDRFNRPYSRIDGFVP